MKVNKTFLAKPDPIISSMQAQRELVVHFSKSATNSNRGKRFLNKRLETKILRTSHKLS